MGVSKDDPLIAALRRKLDATAETVEELREENERLRDRVAELENVVDTDLDALTYEQMTKKDKVRQVRTALLNKAGRNGRAAMAYNEVQSLFNNRPSPGHAYDLMQAAASADGFEYQEPDGPPNRIVVKIEAVNDDALIHAANNEAERVTA